MQIRYSNKLFASTQFMKIMFRSSLLNIQNFRNGSDHLRHYLHCWLTVWRTYTENKFSVISALDFCTLKFVITPWFNGDCFNRSFGVCISLCRCSTYGSTSCTELDMVLSYLSLLIRGVVGSSIASFILFAS